MKNKIFLNLLTLSFFFNLSCDQTNSRAADKDHDPTPSLSTRNIDSSFQSFITYFSQDSTFQKSRTKFPLPVSQYDVVHDKDTLILLPLSSFGMMDFRILHSDGNSNQWEQKTVLDNDPNKATIEIRGIENGIMVDYQFEKQDGKWMLVAVNDGST